MGDSKKPDRGQVQQKPYKSTIEVPIRLLSALSCRVLVFVVAHQNLNSPRKQDMQMKNAMNMPIRRMESLYAIDQLTLNQLRSYPEWLVVRIRKSKSDLLTEFAQSEYNRDTSIPCLLG